MLDELRQRLKRGERHLHADHQIPITVRPDLRLETAAVRRQGGSNLYEPRPDTIAAIYKDRWH